MALKGKNLTVVNLDTRTVIRTNESPYWAHKLAKEHAASTGQKIMVFKPVALFERTTKKKRFK